MQKRNKFSKKINRFKKRFLIFVKKNKVLLILGLIFLLFIYGIKIAYNKYINNPENIVNSIYFDKNIVNNPNLLYLIEYTNKTFSGTNTAKNKILEYEEQKNNIYKNFPFIDNIKINTLSKKSLKINFNFKKPKLIFIGSGKVFALYDNKNIYPFNSKYISGLNLSITSQIYLPSYIDTSNNLQNIFWKNSSDKLIEYINKIQKELPKSKLFYIVGGENIKVLYEGKIIYFSLQKNIDKQINQLNLIKNKKIFNEAKQIDIGNLETGIYIKGK